MQILNNCYSKRLSILSDSLLNSS